MQGTYFEWKSLGLVVMHKFCRNSNGDFIVTKDKIVAIVITHEDLSKHLGNVWYLIYLLDPTRLQFFINSLVNLGLFEWFSVWFNYCHFLMVLGFLTCWFLGPQVCYVSGSSHHHLCLTLSCNLFPTLNLVVLWQHDASKWVYIEQQCVSVGVKSLKTLWENKSMRVRSLTREKCTSSN